MNEILLAVAMLVSSTGVSPAPETARATVVPAVFTFDLPDEATWSRNLSHRLPNEQFRPAWRRGSLQPSQPTPANRLTKTEKIIVVVSGGVVGWWVGGAIGYAATSKPRDDVSGLKGVVIGAPIGAVVGAVIGYRLTK
jgi:hypothetical protein